MLEVLPKAAYVTLAPFVGPVEALEQVVARCPTARHRAPRERSRALGGKTEAAGRPPGRLSRRFPQGALGSRRRQPGLEVACAGSGRWPARGRDRRGHGGVDSRRSASAGCALERDPRPSRANLGAAASLINDAGPFASAQSPEFLNSDGRADRMPLPGSSISRLCEEELGCSKAILWSYRRFRRRAQA